MENQICQICKTRVDHSERYPNYVCENCSSESVSKDGRPLIFSNTAFTGGFKANFKDSLIEYKEESGHICFIKNIKCWAEEAHLGGIVIETYYPIISNNFFHIKNNLKRIKIKLEAAQTKIHDYIIEDPLRFFYKLKYEKLGYDPLGSGFREENLIEQINQTFTSIVTFLALRYLMEKFGEDIYEVNCQTESGFDIVNKEKGIIAEVFSTVDIHNNNKLKKDIEKISNLKSENKYIFYYAHKDSNTRETKDNEINIIKFSKEDLEAAFD